MATFPHSEAPLKTVQEIQFGLFSPDEIKKMSVVHCEYADTMDEQKHRPRERGLLDPKLGTIDRNLACGTCGESQQECPGHFGHIELAVPVYHGGMPCLQLHVLCDLRLTWCDKDFSPRSRKSSNRSVTTVASCWTTR
jgi:hypothetical protein